MTLPKGLKRELRPYQLEAVEYARSRKRVFICDDVGLGKTATALAVIADHEAFPALIVVPSFLRGHWQRQIELWVKNATVQVIETGETRMTIPSLRHFTVISYDLLHKFVGKIAGGLKPHAVVFDESQKIKGFKTRRTKSAKQVVGNAGIRLCLTASPIENRPSELAPQFDVLGQAGIFGSGGTWTFLQTFTNAVAPYQKNPLGYWDFSGARDLVRLNTILKDKCMIRRTRAQVQQELPERTTSVVPMTLDLASLNEYLYAEKNLRAWLSETGQREVTGAFRDEAMAKMEVLKQIAVRGRMSQMLDWIETFLESGEKLVIFTTHTAVLLKFLDAFPKVSAVIYGETPPHERERVVERFNVAVSDGGVQLLVVNVLAGGIGIDLTAAASCAFAEMAWTASAHYQAEGRLHRQGQTRPVQAYYFVAPGTVEEEIQAMLAAKAEIMAAAVDGIPTAGEAEASKDLVNRVAEIMRRPAEIWPRMPQEARRASGGGSGQGA